MISYALISLLPLLAVLVAPPTAPSDGCPSARQVTEAMQVRFPALLVTTPESAGATGQSDSSRANSSRADALRADTLRSVLDAAPDGTVLRFSLLDARGETRLRRTLPAPARGRVLSECLALADTVAAIVERYLATIAYEAGDGPPPPPDEPAAAVLSTSPPPAPATIAPRPRTASVFAGLAWRSTAGGRGEQSGVEGRLGGQFDLTRSLPRLAARLTIGAAPGITASLMDRPRTVTLRRFPARIGALLALPVGSGWLEPMVQGGVDLLVLSSTAGEGGVPAATMVVLAPVLEAGVGYRLQLGGRFFLRPGVAIGVALKRYDTTVENDPDVGPLATPWTYASFGIDTAMVF